MDGNRQFASVSNNLLPTWAYAFKDSVVSKRLLEESGCFFDVRFRDRNDLQLVQELLQTEHDNIVELSPNLGFRVRSNQRGERGIHVFVRCLVHVCRVDDRVNE